MDAILEAVELLLLLLDYKMSNESLMVFCKKKKYENICIITEHTKYYCPNCQYCISCDLVYMVNNLSFLPYDLSAAGNETHLFQFKSCKFHLNIFLIRFSTSSPDFSGYTVLVHGTHYSWILLAMTFKMLYSARQWKEPMINIYPHERWHFSRHIYFIPLPVTHKRVQIRPIGRSI